jgi:hypothetical protein
MLIFKGWRALSSRFLQHGAGADIGMRSFVASCLSWIGATIWTALGSRNGSETLGDY